MFKYKNNRPNQDVLAEVSHYSNDIMSSSFFPARLRRTEVIALHIPIFGLNYQEATHPQLSISTRLSVCCSLSLHEEAASLFKQHNESFTINGNPTSQLNSKVWSQSPTWVHRRYPSVVKGCRPHEKYLNTFLTRK